MKNDAKPVSVVIPTGGDQRMHLLEATIAGLKRAKGIDQIILSELGRRPFAYDLARNQNVDYVFSFDSGPFNRSRSLNIGSKLTRRKLILWCDGDTLFDADLLTRAVAEMKRRKLDILMPFSTFHCLNENQTENVLSGNAAPDTYTPDTYRKMHGEKACGGLILVKAEFLRRYGGHSEVFQGWGYEDNAWVHKAKLLGKIGWDEDSELHVCNLFHPNSTRDDSNVESNKALFQKISSITNPDELLQEFPHELNEAPPWPRSAAIAFVAAKSSTNSPIETLARNWINRLEEHYGIAPRLTFVRPGHSKEFSRYRNSEVVVLFAETSEVAENLLANFQDQPAIVVLMSKTVSRDSDLPVLGDHQPHWLLARTTDQATLWRKKDNRIWHRNWENGEVKAQPVPVLAQLLSLALETPKQWSIKIEVDRATLPATALDRSPFWYVAVHDVGGNELARCDTDLEELNGAITSNSDKIILERTIQSALRPVTWTVQPTDRHRNWLDRLEGTVRNMSARVIL